MVTVRVGTNEPKDFYIHKERLCQYSPFFKSALDRDWSEAKSNTINLPDDTAETFGIYCEWLYNISPFRVSDVLIGQDSKQRFAAFHRDSDRYYHAYVFGDKVLDPKFTDMLIDRWMANMKKWNFYPVDELFKIFNLSAKGHPVRQLLIDVMLYTAHEGWSGFPFWNDANNLEALSEITKAFIRQRGAPLDRTNPPFHKQDMCKYHSHAGTDNPCYKAQEEWRWLREGNEA